MRSLRGRVGLAELVLPQSDPQQRPLGPGAVASRVVTTKALAPARERELVLAAAAGDRAACEKLVQAFLPAIAGVARRYRGAHSVQRPELLQEGVVGLLRAIKRSIRQSERRSGLMPLGGSARRCSNSSRRCRGRPCYLTGRNALLRAFGRPAVRTSSVTDESLRSPN